MHAQSRDTLNEGFSIAARYGLSLPLGRFAGNPGRIDGEKGEGTTMLGAGGNSGPMVSASIHYTFASRLGLFISAASSTHAALNENYSGYPWNCDHCGLGYIAPTVKDTRTDAGRWRSTSVALGASYALVRGEPTLVVRAGVGYQILQVGEIRVQQEGLQLVYNGAPPYSTLPFERSLVQHRTTEDGLVYELGLDLRHPLVGPLSVSVATSLLWGPLRMKGEQESTYNGATQLQTEIHWKGDVHYEELSSVTRLGLQLGFAVDL